MLFQAAAAAAVRCVWEAALLREDAFLVCPKCWAWQQNPGSWSWGKYLHPRGIMLTCRLCWLAEVGAALRAICCDLCLWATVLPSSWAMWSKRFQWKMGLVCSLKPGRNACVCGFCVCGRREIFQGYLLCLALKLLHLIGSDLLWCLWNAPGSFCFFLAWPFEGAGCSTWGYAFIQKQRYSALYRSFHSAPVDVGRTEDTHTKCCWQGGGVFWRSEITPSGRKEVPFSEEEGS